MQGRPSALFGSQLLVSLSACCPSVCLSICRGGGEVVVKVLVKYDLPMQYSKAYGHLLKGAVS